MRVLVLGGSVFLSREVVARAVAAGHEVTAACRGASGSVPEGAQAVRWDRAQPAPADLAAQTYDAVVDVARLPSWVRRDVAVWPDAHWVFVSTVNVYAEEVPGGTPATLPLLEAQHEDVDPGEDPAAYGAMKVACEEAVRAGAGATTVVRPGLIVGPADPTGRFTYWPARLDTAAPGEEVLAPGSPDDVVQVVDVRDLASWLVELAERRATGAYDGVGPTLALGDLLAGCAAGVGAHPSLTWVDHAFLEEQGVAPWMGPGSVPLWLPRPAYDGMLAHDPAPSVAAGLSCRSVAQTARDTRDWWRREDGAAVTGITVERERELLGTYRRRGGRG